MPDNIAEAVLAAVELVIEPIVGRKIADAVEPSERRVSVTPSARMRRGAAPVTEASITWYIEVDTPIGLLMVSSEDDAITGVYMESHRHGPVDRESWLPDVKGVRPVLNTARAQLAEFFSGRRHGFDLKLRARGTEVQQRVWRALLDIPFGETRSYGEIARAVSDDSHKVMPQEVGQACGRNPIPIIQPCHRVLAAGGALGGFSAPGGVETKLALLRHEGAMLL